MLNLLPQKQKVQLKKEYFLRRVIVGLELLLVVLVISLILLTPSYFLTRIRAEEASVELESVRRQLDSRLPPAEMVREISNGVRDAGALRPLANQRSAYELIRIFESRPITIKISEIEFSAPAAGQAQILVKGVAADRESLTAFGRTLEGRAEFQTVNVPVSNFVKEKNIDFLMTITLK